MVGSDDQDDHEAKGHDPYQPMWLLPSPARAQGAVLSDPFVLAFGVKKEDVEMKQHGQSYSR